MSSRVRGTNSDEWSTPQELWDLLNKQYNFTFDVAASVANHKCDRFYSQNYSFLIHKNDDLLTFDVLWCNPPFSQAKKFIDLLAEVNKPTVCIYRCDNMETKLWQSIFKHAEWIFLFNKRIHYDNPVGGDTCPFGSALFGWNCAPPIGLKGTLLTSWEDNG
jgi:phage N-6-adenine-methyltransferase